MSRKGAERVEHKQFEWLLNYIFKALSATLVGISAIWVLMHGVAAPHGLTDYLTRSMDRRAIGLAFGLVFWAWICVALHLFLHCLFEEGERTTERNGRRANFVLRELSKEHHLSTSQVLARVEANGFGWFDSGYCRMVGVLHQLDALGAITWLGEDKWKISEASKAKIKAGPVFYEGESQESR